MFNLDNRLLLCAGFIREGAKIADIGTDHAYLPVWLALNGKISSAVASDVRKGPLENAKSNIEKNGVSDKVKAILSDGLDNISEEDADDIIMAGMGGELMIRLTDRTPWLKNSDKHLILQPMTRAESLRKYLCENGFEIMQEKACISLGKAYSVMLCRYDGMKRECSEEFAYIGALGKDNSDEAKRYIYVVNEKLKKKIKGFSEGTQEYKKMLALIEKLTAYYKTEGE